MHLPASYMTLLQWPNSLSSTLLTLEVFSLEHWRQSAFAKTQSMLNAKMLKSVAKKPAEGELLR